MAYLPQQIASFNAGFPSTVYEFVKSGRYPRKGWFRRLTKHDLEHVQRALESVGMWENRHKQIGRLSGGQKQRLSIARAVLHRAPFLILDDATSALDTITESNLLKAVQDNLPNTSLILISQRTSTLKIADQILLLEKGEQLALGNHEELMETSQVYREINASQHGKEE